MTFFHDSKTEIIHVNTATLSIQREGEKALTHISKKSSKRF